MPDLLWPIVLLCIALGVLCLELFIPSGGMLSVISGLFYLGAIAVSFVNGGPVVGGIFTAVTGTLLPLLLILLVRWWPKTAIGRRVLINPPPAEELVPEEVQALRELIGQRGRALTPMLPSGAIRLDRQTIDAVSEGMSIDAGTCVEVIAAKGNHLVVRPIPEGDPSQPEIVSGRPLDAIVPDPFEDPLT